jgi:SAM-dependent methyltransferase
MSQPAVTDTQDAAYADRLLNLQTKWWKKIIPVQAPYRWNMKRLGLGFTLDIGCGIGRSLLNLDGHGVGIDHNAQAVAVCRQRGLKAFTNAEFQSTEYNRPATFDSLMLAHTAEHMTPDESKQLISTYVGLLKPGGRLLMLTPQDRGYRSDASHVTFVDFTVAEDIARACGFDIEKQFSFPFPHTPGRHFIYNEYVTLGRLKPAT